MKRRDAAVQESPAEKFLGEKRAMAHARSSTIARTGRNGVQGARRGARGSEDYRDKC
jgi:hypothetical protein